MVCITFCNLKTSGPRAGWSKAIPIGIFAGIPTAVFLQVGFVKTLAERGIKLKPSRFAGLYPPGLGFAIVRDCVYWGATQKQVQTPKPTWTEELTCQICVVAIPLVCDTISVRVVEPDFKWPKTMSGTLAMACPPAALLGRATWIPIYNWAYVVAQQQIGTSSWIAEGAGLVAGSIAASFVAYPLFVLKTNLLLLGEERFTLSGLPRLAIRALLKSFGADSFRDLRKNGPRSAYKSLFLGVRPHAAANLGPDVLCMAAGRLLYSLFFKPSTDDQDTQLSSSR